MTIRAALVPELLARFEVHGPIRGEHPEAVVTFPARHAGFGDVAVYDDGDEATVVVGGFTHFHVEDYTERASEAERIAAIVGNVVEWLEGLFDDRVIASGSHKDGGGCEWIEPGDTFEESTDHVEGWVWSGPWRRHG